MKEFYDDSDKILGLCRGQAVDIDGDETDGSILYRVPDQKEKRRVVG